MTFLADFDIRYSDEGDLPHLQKWFEPEGATDAFPFGQEEKNDALKNWIGFARYKASLTGMIHGKPCAVGTLFLMSYKKVAHHCSFYLMVDPDHRRKGVGLTMVRNLMHLAKTRFRLESLHAEIYEPSHMLPLLEKLRFAVFARQENFVHIDGCERARILLEHFFA